MSGPLSVRLAVPDDGEAIGRIHVETWRTAYRGVVSDAHLDGLDPVERGRIWRARLDGSAPSIALFTLVAVEESGRVIGFASGGRERSRDPDHGGEIYALYVLRDEQRRGAGRLLVSESSRRLLAEGIDSMLLWVLARGPAVGFYERLGGVRLRTKLAPVGGEEHEEIAFGWRDLSRLGS